MFDSPLFSLDSSQIYSLFELPPYLILWNFIINGGWLIFLILILWASWNYWLIHVRQKFAESIEYVLLTINVPKNNIQGPESVERLFSQLAGARSGGSKLDIYFRGYVQPSFSFELVSIEGQTRYFIRTPVQFRDTIEAAIYSAYTDAEIIESEDYVEGVPDHFPDSEYDVWASDLVLYNKDFYPIRTYPSFEHSFSKEFKDPLSVLLEMMSKLQPGEQLWTQLIVTPISNDWKNQANNFVKRMMGIKVPASKSWFEKIFGFVFNIFDIIIDIFVSGKTEEGGEEKKDVNLSPGERRALEAVQAKSAKTGFRVKYRVVYIARKEVFSKARGVVGFLGALNQFNTLDMNGFKPDDQAKTSKPMFFGNRRLATKQTRLVKSYKKRNRFVGAKNCLLNTEELATLYHFPLFNPDFKTSVPLIKKTGSKRGEPPLGLPTA